VKIFSVVEDGLQVVGSASLLRTAALAFLKGNINQKFIYPEHMMTTQQKKR
jgi:hypothetical protein